MSLDLCLIPTVTKQHIGGRIAYFYRKRQNITSDPWVVETVVGYKRVFLESPHQAYIPTVHASMEDKDLKDQEVLSLQQKPNNHKLTQFISLLFTVPKIGSGHWPVVNFKNLNLFESINISKWKVCQH